MKELSIEEKAKAYDEAKARMSRAFNSNRCTIGFMNEIFPELVENEDERIRKEMIEIIKNEAREFPSSVIANKSNSWIAYLEKQGEQKTVDEIAKEVCKDKASAVAFLKSAGIINEKGELAEQYRQDEQKPSWSEEDEKMLNRAVKLIRPDNNHSDYAKYKLQIVEWLKSLRPQNKYTYNPYKEVVESIAEMCKHYDKASHSGLRDFYDNVKVKCKDAKEYDSLFPQNTWKPSMAQLNALSIVSKGNATDDIEAIVSLYNDLNKLT